jgi:hypothetical protein
MTLLPDGRTASYVEGSERSAKVELRRLTEAYLARVRSLYPDIAPQDQAKVAAAMQALKAAVMPHWYRR